MSNNALILLDLQVGIMNMLEDGKASYFSHVAEAIKAAREAQIHIIYVTTSFRPGHPEVSRSSMMGSRVAKSGGFIDGDASVAISPEVAPLDGDILITKRRVSALAGSDLDVVLRGLQVQSLVLAGVATSGAVLSTLRQAADLDYNLTVLEDLCLDRDPEVHRVLVEKIFPGQARTISATQWIQEIGASRE